MCHPVAEYFDQVDIGDVEFIANDADGVILTRVVEPEIALMIREVGNWQLRSVGVNTAFNMLDARVVGYLTEFAGYKIRLINETTRRAIVVALAEGISLGEGSTALARRIRKVFDGRSKAGALAIARSETTAATGFARQQAFDQVGASVIAGKKWRATRDARTRRTHRELDNEVRPINGFFQTFTGFRAQYPGGFAVARENVNCRCTIVPVFPRVDGIKNDALNQMEQEFERIYDRWERRIERAFRRGLRMQETVILEALERVENE